MRVSLSLLVCHKAKAQKEASFLWSVIHKAFAVNEWHGNISTEFDKSCIHYGSHLVELVEHKFYICSTDVPSLNMGGVTLPTSFGNSSPKKTISARKKSFFYVAMFV
jgi:hypothetical protein